MKNLIEYGPWALVTGASSGIGRAFAVEMARGGLSVVASVRNEAALLDLEHELRAEGSPAVRRVALDMGHEDAADVLSDRVDDLDIGVVVVSAGFGSSGPFFDWDPDVEAGMVDVNCRALMRMAHIFGRRMSQRDRAALVLMSSIVAFQGAPYSANYAATKSYVQSPAEGIGYETRRTGLRVVSCAPGPVRSGFAGRAGMNMSNAQTPESVARGALSKLHRGGTSRPGLLTKFLSSSLATLPRAGRVRVMAKIMSGMAAPSASAARPQAALGNNQ